MTLAARCPWCETVFRLTEGQVAAKAGMARCGVCSHTFNVLDALLSDSAVAALERGAQAREANQEATLRASAQAAQRPSAPEPAPPQTIESAPVAVPAAPKAAPAPLLSVPSFLWRKTPAAAQTPSVPAIDAQHQHNESRPTPVQPAVTPAVTPALGPNPAPKDAAPIEIRVDARVLQPVAKPIEMPLQKPFEAIPLVPPPAGLRADDPASATGKESSIAASAPPAMALWKSDAPTPKASEPIEVKPAQLAVQTPSPGASSPALASDYQIELPNYDAERTVPEAVESPPAVEPLRVEDHLAAIRAVRTAVLNSPGMPIPSAGSDDEDDADELQEEAAHEPAPVVISVRDAAPVPAPSLDLVREEERLGPPTFQPSFLLAAEQAGPGRLFLRFVGGLACIVLFLALAAQAAYWWRSDLALRVPQTRPYLFQACARLGCDIEAPAEIDQLSIESSELVAVPGLANTLSFTALVRNHSSSAISYPAIEVTLTDAHDQAILRRVFFPKSYLSDASKQHVLAGIAANSEFSLKLTFNTSGVATTGYRAGIFYP